jgi:LysR family glycine cleavage system transcriptional activator
MVRRLPPLNALRAFEAAARLGSFKSAADELNVTPAAISHQVKSLEDVLGLELFLRLPRGLMLTEAGRAYLPNLTRGFDRLAQASDALQGGELAGLLTVSALPSFAHCWLVPRLADFRQRFPQIDFRLDANPEMSNFGRDQVDVGIRYGRGNYKGMREIRFLTEELFPVASPALLSGPFPIRQWEDLSHHTLLDDYTALPDEYWITWHPWLQSQGLSIEGITKGSVSFNNSAMMVEAAIAGMGVMIGRSALVAHHLRDGRLVSLFDCRRPADFSYYVVCPEASAENPRIQVFMDWLQQIAQKDQTAMIGAGPAPLASMG